MTVHFSDDSVTLHHGDCLAVLRELPDNSVDAVVTDPPYNLSFMAKPWDALDGVEDAGFAYWLAGLIDGEGHFAIKAHSRGTHAPQFTLKLRADERGTLNMIRRKFGHGTLTNDVGTNPMLRWTVGDKAGCQALVDMLDKYPLRAKKMVDYWTWRAAVIEWTSRPRGNRWHGPADNSRMEQLRTALMDNRQFDPIAWSGNEFQDWCRLWARECLRVLKPGGHLLAFGGSRTWHRLAAGVEDAGFEIRDSIAWLYGSGFPKSLSVHKASLAAVESRYGTARCDCVDASDGQPYRDDIGREGRGDSGTSGGSSQVPAPETRATHVSVEPSANSGAMCELREDDAAQAEGPPPLGAPVLFEGMRERRSEAPRHRHAPVRPGMEEPSRGDPQARQDVSVVREDAGTEQVGIACSSPEAVQVRRDEPADEPGGAVRFVPPRHRSGDRSGSGIDPDRRDPRRVHLDGDGRGTAAVARICSWCGWPDADWLASAESLGTALKPAFEPIVVGRKPLAGTVAANVLEHGTGALNINGCRTTPAAVDDYGRSANKADGTNSPSRAIFGGLGPKPTAAHGDGRWPTNVLLDESQADALDEQTGVSRSRSGKPRKAASGEGWRMAATGAEYDDSGGASRFFPTFRYQAKAPADERPTYQPTRLRLRSDLTPEQVDRVTTRLREAGVDVA